RSVETGPHVQEKTQTKKNATTIRGVKHPSSLPLFPQSDAAICASSHRTHKYRGTIRADDYPVAGDDHEGGLAQAILYADRCNEFAVRRRHHRNSTAA